MLCSLCLFFLSIIDLFSHCLYFGKFLLTYLQDLWFFPWLRHLLISTLKVFFTPVPVFLISRILLLFILRVSISHDCFNFLCEPKTTSQSESEDDGERSLRREYCKNIIWEYEKNWLEKYSIIALGPLEVHGHMGAGIDYAEIGSNKGFEFEYKRASEATESTICKGLIIMNTTLKVSRERREDVKGVRSRAQNYDNKIEIPSLNRRSSEPEWLSNGGGINRRC